MVLFWNTVQYSVNNFDHFAHTGYVLYVYILENVPNKCFDIDLNHINKVSNNTYS